MNKILGNDNYPGKDISNADNADDKSPTSDVEVNPLKGNYDY